MAGKGEGSRGERGEKRGKERGWEGGERRRERLGCGCYDSNAQLRIGNIMEQGLAELRDGKAYTDILEGFRAGDVRHVPMCGQCDDPFG